MIIRILTNGRSLLGPVRNLEFAEVVRMKGHGELITMNAAESISYDLPDPTYLLHDVPECHRIAKVAAAFFNGERPLNRFATQEADRDGACIRGTG